MDKSAVDFHRPSDIVDVPLIAADLVQTEGFVLALTANLGRRLGSACIDFLVYSGVLYVSVLALGELGAYLALAVLLGIMAVQGFTGQTPGKKATGTFVVRSRSWRLIELEGFGPAVAAVTADPFRSIGPVVSVLRYVLHLLDCLPLVGLLVPLMHRRDRFWSDTLTGTIVIRTGRPTSVPYVAAV